MTTNITFSWILVGQENTKNVISPEQFEMVNTIFITLALALSFAGLVTNAFNIRTFLAVGLKDGVSISLISLSMSDLGYCAASFILGTTTLFTQIENQYGIIYYHDPFAVTMFIVDVGLTFYGLTVLSTTYLAVARCMCVFKPLHFKNVFSRSRSVVIHVFFAVFAMACYSPVFSQMGTRRQFDRRANTTRIKLWFSDVREEIKDIVFMFFDTIFSFATQIVVIVCVIVMAECLRKSAIFRNVISKVTKDDENKESEYKLSGKELQVVKQVTLISTMYALCSLPKMYNAAYSLLEPEFDVGKAQQFFYFSLNYMRNIFEIANSASTFFIYYNFNSAFRSFWTRKKQ